MSTKVDLSAARKRAEETGVLGGGNIFKVKEGDNRMRLVSECLEHPGVYNGKPTFKWFRLILDRVDGMVKRYFMPNAVFEQIEALQLNPDYKFEEVPMPYDFTVNAKGAGKKEKEVVYTVVSARANTPLMQAELAAIAEADNVRDIQRELQRAQAEKENGGAQETTITAE